MSVLPILYSFRRCPYAMRARLALAVSAQTCELREVVLRDKPQELLGASPKGTVPVLIVESGVIAESLDIMLWALRCNDPEDWLTPLHGSLDDMLMLIGRCDDEFKYHLDRYKYPDRYDAARDAHRGAGAVFLQELDSRLSDEGNLFGRRPALADMAILPFVRQFANTDDRWFADQPWAALQRWLLAFEQSTRYEQIMRKYPPWQSGAVGVPFPNDAYSCR